jgi:hypothetical protein
MQHARRASDYFSLCSVCLRQWGQNFLSFSFFPPTLLREVL